MSQFREIYARKTDPHKLIAAVKEHPCLWDSHSPDYRVKKEKQEAWETVASKVIGEWEQYIRTERHHSVRGLVKRWNNIRDYYNKALKAARRAQFTGEPYRKKKYMFAKALDFLRPELERNINVFKLSETTTSLKVEADDEEEEVEEPDEAEEEEECQDIRFVDAFDNSYDDNTATNTTTMKKVLEVEEDRESSKQEDTDLMFLKSLLPDMKKLRDEEKFQFKYSIMKAYMDILNKRKQ